MKKTYIRIGIAMMALFIAAPALAATLKSGETITFSEPISDDLYVAGGNVFLEETADADVVLMGGQVLASGSVGQDLMIGGGTITVNSDVGDDLRIGGGNITVISQVADDLLIGGGSVTISGGSKVGGDAVIAGGALVIDGEIDGNLKVYGGEVIFNGTVNGTVLIEADELVMNGTVNGPSKLVAYNIKIQDKALFNEDVVYWNNQGNLNFGDALVSGTAHYDPSLRSAAKHSKQSKGFLAGLVGAWFVLSLLSAALMLLIFRLTLKKFFHTAAKQLDGSPWSIVGMGILYIIATPVLAILLMITVFGIPLALLILAMYIFSLVFANIISAYVITLWLARRYKQQWKPIVVFLISLLVFIVLKLLMFIPIIGWVLVLIVISAGLGSVIKAKVVVHKQMEG